MMNRHNREPEVLIDWFDDFHGPNPYSFLSNFYEGSPVFYGGTVFPTAEHAFAWAKVDSEADDAGGWKLDIVYAEDPGAAKHLGRQCPLRPDWDAIKFSVMRDIVWEKFTQHPKLAAGLLATNSAYLQEGTYWNDRIWGVDITASADPFERPGWNMLGAILMEARARLNAIGLAERNAIAL